MGKTQLSCGLIVLRGNFEEDFTRLAVCSFDCIHHAGAALGRNRQTIHQNNHRLAEVDVEQRFRSRELKHPPTLIQAVESSLPQIEEACLERFGELCAL